uniref:NADH dehydrogenase subunit 4 n=1 Tax=Ixodes woyliei TaxID=1933095 RepID=UPI001FF12E69|nr:NADH dehydrogenase subunit 4 [Ixodes woyliei]UOK09769.1 NADH dehydrogenase subunit 4 [Ixodes woyliei]
MNCSIDNLFNFCFNSISYDNYIIIFFFFFFFFFFLSFLGNELNYMGLIMGGDIMSMCLMMLTIWVIYLMMMSSFLNNLFENKMFMMYLMMMLFFLLMCFYSLSLLMFYFFFESVLFPIILIIFNWGNQPERLQAGIYMLMYTLFGSYPLLVIMLLYGEESLNYFYMNIMMSFNTGYLFFFMILGFLVKIPMFFVHLWLPKAHVEAPISGSMILAAVLLKLGVYGLYRFKVFYLKEMMMLGYVIMVVSVMGGMIVGLMCVFQVDMKALIAYSSVCHMGLVLGGMITWNFWSSYGSLLLMIGHGLCSSGLFCLANYMYERFFTRSILLMKGVGKFFPNLCLWWFLFSVINMSAPLSMNLFGEIFLIGSMIKFSMMFIFPLMMISFLSAGYSLYMFSYTQHGEGSWLFAVKLIEIREYMVIMFHFFPMIIWIMKMEMFSNWF